MIDAQTLGPREPVYTHVAPNGTNTHIHAGRLREWLLSSAHPRVNTPVDFDAANRFLRDNIICADRARELIDRFTKTPEQPDPIIWCKDGTIGSNGHPNVLLVDGHHRYFIAAQYRIPFITAWIVEHSLWQPFRIHNMPDVTINQLRAMPITKRSY